MHDITKKNYRKKKIYFSHFYMTQVANSIITSHICSYMNWSKKQRRSIKMRRILGFSKGLLLQSCTHLSSYFHPASCISTHILNINLKLIFKKPTRKFYTSYVLTLNRQLLSISQWLKSNRPPFILRTSNLERNYSL